MSSIAEMLRIAALGHQQCLIGRDSDRVLDLQAKVTSCKRYDMPRGEPRNVR